MASADKTPLVAIRCLTFNHGPYIEEALKGFVTQQTKFPFVAIVHDDASTDSTADIIRKYEKKYPDVIKPILQTENQFSKHDGSLGRIINGACFASGAKYIAMCEGDDYWIDPEKLQLQVDFLESHPEYSMCFHRVNVLNEDTKSIDSGCSNVKSKDYEHAEIQEKLLVPTCSVLMRSECLQSMPKDPDFIVGDNVLWATCRSMGKVRGFDRVMGVYRRVSTGWTAQYSNLGKEKYYNLQLAWIKHRRAMKLHFPDVEDKVFDNPIAENMAIVTILDARIYHSNFKRHFSEYYKEYGFRYLRKIVEVLWHSVRKRI